MDPSYPSYRDFRLALPPPAFEIIFRLRARLVAGHYDVGHEAHPSPRFARACLDVRVHFFGASARSPNSAVGNLLRS